MYIVLGNFGNHCHAALQFLLEARLAPVQLIAVDTGWAAHGWMGHVDHCQALWHQRGIIVHRPQAKAGFPELVRDRRQFPSEKFQWCAGFLKGLAINAILDEIDPFGQATLVSGKRRLDSRRFITLAEYEDNQELFGFRRLWQPLYLHDDAAFKALISRSGVAWQTQPSQECSPCIHDPRRGQGLAPSDLARLQALEAEIGSDMFAQHPATREEATGDLSQFDFGCGSPWACGE